MTYKSIFSAVGIVAAVFCVGCGGGKRPPELVGQWELASETAGGELENMELLKNGTGTVDNGGAIKWKVENERFVIVSASTAVSYGYEVSGYELILVSDGGDSTIYVTKGRLEEFREKQVKQTIEQLEQSFVSVQGGKFKMGCTAEQGKDCYNDGKPVHSVTVGSFQIGKHEVTQKQWKAVMGGENPSEFKGDDNLPVEQVSWNDVQEFIKKLNEATGKTYRLPTEAEWEYAARGGDQSKGYKYSGSNDIDEVAWYGDNSGKKTRPVGTKQANELGIYDMTGNVWEWLSDRYKDNYYASSPAVDPTGPKKGSTRVCRGGSWGNGERYGRVAYREDTVPDGSGFELGFRLAISP